MKENFFKISIAIVVMGAIYVAFNQIDIESEDLATRRKEFWGNPSYGTHNAYFHLWALPEPPDVDIEGEETLTKYRHLYHSQSDYDKYWREWVGERHRQYRHMYHKHWTRIILSGKKLNIPFESMADYGKHFLKNKEKILKFQKEAEVLMKRCERMMDCEVFEDFTAVDISSPIPNLLIWLNVARQYNRYYFLYAFDGNWQAGTAKLLRHLQFAKKANKGSIVLITNLVAKAVFRHTLYTIAGLMNIKEFPAEVFEQVLANMPELQYEDYGSWPIHGELLMLDSYNWELVDAMEKITFLEKHLLPFFTNENRTGTYPKDFLLKAIERDKTPPYKWGTGTLDIKKAMSGWFWWLQNPGGKIMFDKYIRKPILELRKVVYKTHLTKTIYDMVRISAELHLNYTPDKPVQEILNGLKTYRNLPDRCSNKPYKWNEAKQLLYSIGTDRKDDDGRYDYEKLNDCDYVLPCILYLK